MSRSPARASGLALAGALVYLAGAPAGLLAQAPETLRPAPAEPPDPYDGRLIRELRLLRRDPADPSKVQPVSGALEQLIRNQVRSVPGLPFSRAAAREDVTRLNRLGRFRTIESDVQLLSDGSVTLILTVAEQPMIEDVQVVGNKTLDDQEILQTVGGLAGTPVDRFQIDRAARQIEDLYRAKGYYQARVQVDEKALAEASIVVFRVIEGRPVSVTGVRFEGNNTFSAKELRSQIRTTTFVPIFESAPLDDDVLNEDKVALMRFYRERGYLDAKVGARVQPSPDGREVIVTFEVQEGPLYTLRSVRVLYATPAAVEQYRREVLKDERAAITYLDPEQMRQIGRRPFSDEQVAGLMVMKPGDVYSDDKLRKSQDALRVAYGKLGYLIGTGRTPETVDITPQVIRDEHAPLVDLHLFLREGEPALTGEVKVTGNDLTKQQVILREARVYPGRPLDAAQLQESEARLEQLRLFEPRSIRITVQPEERTNPGYRDVAIQVKETNTGRVIMGAAVGSDSGVVGQFIINQRNFDVADFPDSWDEFFSGRAFRGAGQTAELAIQPGNQQSDYSVRLTEPHLFESDYSGTARVFYRERDQRIYDEDRYGVQTGFARRFGSVWEGALTIRAESINLSNIEPDRPVDVFDVQDPHTLTAVSLSFTRNTVPVTERLRPSRGAQLELGIDQFGALGGDFDFTRLRYEYTSFFPVYESFLGYRTVLKLHNRVEYIPQGQDAAPIYERLYLGGQSFRGFAYRGVSPVGIRNDNMMLGDDPVGGTFMFALGAELNQPIYKDIVSLVAFMDTGTVDTHVSFQDYRITAGLGIRLYIRQLSPVPLAFDFGFPILSEDTDRERVMTFSLDLPYQ